MSIIEFAIENWQTFGVFSILFVVVGFIFKGIMKDMKLLKEALEKHIKEDDEALSKHIQEGNANRKELKSEMVRDIETNRNNIVKIYELLRDIQASIAEVKGYITGKEKI